EKNKGSEFTLTVSTGKLDKSTFTTTCTHITETGLQDIVESCNNLQGHVLLAEDTPDLQALTSFIIRKTGATVCVVGNGKDAVKEALKNDYDIIFMDIHMPVMDGYEAVKTLRKQNYNKPIIAMTANTMKEDRDNAHRAGCDGFVGKPINRNELYSILKQNLKQSDETQNELPLSSSLLEEEPELVDLVQKFINNMPELIQQYRTSYNNKNWKQLKEDIHVLKALGGGHGYQDITNTALHIEQCITSNEYEAIEQHLSHLDKLTTRAASKLST
ncbi:MAG: response regulator, partial [Gammaproteobacteria bacterium]|nr:response regulator [Gammaproteobacteria bacterium]